MEFPNHFHARFDIDEGPPGKVFMQAYFRVSNRSLSQLKRDEYEIHCALSDDKSSGDCTHKG